MAIMLGGAAAGAAKKIKETRSRRSARIISACRRPRLEYRDGAVVLHGRSGEEASSWEAIAEIAHRKFHELPPGMEPGLQASHVLEVPTGGALPTADGRVQMYPCYAFEAHVVYAEIDRITGQVTLGPYVVGHDCGTMINPDIVHGMTYGGIAHGIGAALYERFRYDESGQFISGTFMDYLIPSAHEVPDVKIVDHCTPSPLTSFGQKGSGEAGYLGAPAGDIMRRQRRAGAAGSQHRRIADDAGRAGRSHCDRGKGVSFLFVTPAKAGVQGYITMVALDSRVRGNDDGKASS